MWYYSINNESLGPFNEGQMMEMIKTGVMSSDTLVWMEDLENWRGLQSSELARYLPNDMMTIPSCKKCGKRFEQGQIECPDCFDPYENVTKYENESAHYVYDDSDDTHQTIKGYSKKIFYSMSPTQWMALLLMLIPVVISIISINDRVFQYTQKHGIFRLYRTTTETLNFAPTLISVSVAIILHSLMVLRRGTLRFGNLYEYLILILNILFSASFVTILTGDKIRIPLLGEYNPQVLILSTIIFTAVGMKSIAGFGWIALSILSFSSLTNASKALGLMGAIYVLCAYLSILTQAKNSLDIGFIQNLRDDFFAGARIVGEAMNEGGEAIVKTTKKIL